MGHCVKKHYDINITFEAEILETYIAQVWIGFRGTIV